MKIITIEQQENLRLKTKIAEMEKEMETLKAELAAANRRLALRHQYSSSSSPSLSSISSDESPSPSPSPSPTSFMPVDIKNHKVSDTHIKARANWRRAFEYAQSLKAPQEAFIKTVTSAVAHERGESPKGAGFNEVFSRATQADSTVAVVDASPVSKIVDESASSAIPAAASVPVASPAPTSAVRAQWGRATVSVLTQSFVEGVRAVETEDVPPKLTNGYAIFNMYKKQDQQKAPKAESLAPQS